MTKPKLHTPNLTAENMEKLAALFPSCVTEAKDEKTGQLKRAIDFDQLRQELSDHIVEGPRERYHLDWPGKREALLAANAPIAKTLRPCREESVDFDTTKNLFIEGDNLDALKLLQETYLGKVKMIYIDPPYNTGNDFIYEDDFSDDALDYLLKSNQKDEAGNRMVANTESNGRFHSDWISMMYARLKLARNILREDGVIFVSTDHKELANLRMIMNEIFGEQNLVGIVSVVSNWKGRSDDKYIATANEFLTIFQKGEFVSLGLPLTQEYLASYTEHDVKGKAYRLLGLRKRGAGAKRTDRPNMFYPFFANPRTSAVSLEQDANYSVKIEPQLSDGTDGRWRWGKPTSKERINLLMARVVTGTDRWDVFEKDYAESEDGFRRIKPKSIWMEKPIANEAGTLEFKALMNGVRFDNPKPSALIRLCLQQATADSDIVVDFFSGSSTTAHAVIAQNADDGGTRRFVMVQLPELCDSGDKQLATIADIGKERIRRVGAKIKAETTTTALNLDVGFRVLKIDASNMKDVYYAPDAVKQDQLELHTNNIKEDRNPEDLLFQVLVDWGVDLALPIDKQTIAGKTVFFVDGNALAACFGPNITEDLVKELAKRKPLRAVFRDSSYDSDSTKINVEQIFKLLSPETEVKSL